METGSGLIDIGMFFGEEEAHRLAQMREDFNQKGVQLVAKQELEGLKAFEVKARDLFCQVTRLESVNKNLTEELNREKTITRETVATEKAKLSSVIKQFAAISDYPVKSEDLLSFTYLNGLQSHINNMKNNFRPNSSGPSDPGTSRAPTMPTPVPVEINLSGEPQPLNRLVDLNSGTTATPPVPPAENADPQVPPSDLDRLPTFATVKQDLEEPSPQGNTTGLVETPPATASNNGVSLASGVINPEEPAGNEAPTSSETGHVSAQTQVSEGAAEPPTSELIRGVAARQLGTPSRQPSDKETPVVEHSDQMELGVNLRREESRAPPSSPPTARRRRLISESSNDDGAQNPPLSSSIRVDSTVKAGKRSVDHSEPQRVPRNCKSLPTRRTVSSKLKCRKDQTGGGALRKYVGRLRHEGESSSKQFKCEEKNCGLAFFFYVQLNLHRRYSHGLQNLSGKNYGCKFCGRILKTSGQLAAHKKYSCTAKQTNKGPRSQPKTFELKEMVLLLNRVDDSQRHEMAPGPSSNSDRCACGRSFPSREKLEAHIRRPY